MNKTLFAAVLSTVLFSTASAFAQTKTYADADVIAATEKFDMTCNEPVNKSVEKIDFKFRYEWDGPTDPERSVTYFIVTCQAGAYNENSVLLRASAYDDTLTPVGFAVPRLNTAGKIAGFTAEVVTGYLTYDEPTKTLGIYSKSRGIGDLYVSGTYELHEDEVILRGYTIDNVAGDNVEVPPVYENKEPLE
ncbi:hypothetical protein BH10BDE1_BH10BDE1_30360 [soil metagenome]